MEFSLLASNSAIPQGTAIINNLAELFQNRTFEIILAAFSGGLFAGLFANYFESRRRIHEKRYDKYFEHRNTIVQIEHELMPARINMARNLASIKNSVENTNQTQVRLILRFFKPFLSTGLSLRLLDLRFINIYSEVYILFETINSDIEYINGMISSIREDLKSHHVDESLLQSYVQMLSYLKEKCEEADRKSLTLLSLSKINLSKSDKDIKKAYLKTGASIKYFVQEKKLKKEAINIEKGEHRPYKKGEMPEKFFAPFMDLKRAIKPN